MVTDADEAAAQKQLPLKIWLEHCQPGETWICPPEHLHKISDYQSYADELIRKRSDQLAIWREEKNLLACKFWPWGPRPKPKKPKNDSWKKSKKVIKFPKSTEAGTSISAQ